MATIKVKNLSEGFQTVITNGKHTIVGDAPYGTDLGLSPGELVLSGLAMCKAATARHVARQKKIELGEIKAELSLTEVKGQPTAVEVKLHFEGNLSEEQKAELLKAADNCHIHQLLNGQWDIKPAK